MNRSPILAAGALLGLTLGACTFESDDAGVVETTDTTTATTEQVQLTLADPPTTSTAPPRLPSEVLPEITAAGVDYEADTPNELEAQFVAFVQAITPDRGAQPILNDGENTCFDLAVAGEAERPTVARRAIARFEVGEAEGIAIVEQLKLTICPGA